MWGASISAVVVEASDTLIRTVVNLLARHDRASTQSLSNPTSSLPGLPLTSTNCEVYQQLYQFSLGFPAKTNSFTRASPAPLRLSWGGACSSTRYLTPTLRSAFSGFSLSLRTFGVKTGYVHTTCNGIWSS